MARSGRLLQQRHPRLGWRAVALSGIAGLAGGDEILPALLATARFRNDVVEREFGLPASAVLTPEPVPPEEIFPTQRGAPVLDPHEDGQPHDARQRIALLHRADAMLRMAGDHHRLAAEEQQHGVAGVADAQWLVTRVEYQNLVFLQKHDCSGYRFSNLPFHCSPEI